MKSDDGGERHEVGAGGPAPTDERRHLAAGNVELMPLLIDDASSDFAVLWVHARRSELAPGVIFSAQGKRWVVTGLSPSGVTFLCREVRNGNRK